MIPENANGWVSAHNSPPPTRTKDDSNELSPNRRQQQLLFEDEWPTNVDSNIDGIHGDNANDSDLNDGFEADADGWNIHDQKISDWYTIAIRPSIPSNRTNGDENWVSSTSSSVPLSSEASWPSSSWIEFDGELSTFDAPSFVQHDGDQRMPVAGLGETTDDHDDDDTDDDQHQSTNDRTEQDDVEEKDQSDEPSTDESNPLRSKYYNGSHLDTDEDEADIPLQRDGHWNRHKSSPAAKLRENLPKLLCQRAAPRQEDQVALLDGSPHRLGATRRLRYLEAVREADRKAVRSRVATGVSSPSGSGTPTKGKSPKRREKMTGSMHRADFFPKGRRLTMSFEELNLHCSDRCGQRHVELHSDEDVDADSNDSEEDRCIRKGIGCGGGAKADGKCPKGSKEESSTTPSSIVGGAIDPKLLAVFSNDNNSTNRNGNNRDSNHGDKKLVVKKNTAKPYQTEGNDKQTDTVSPNRRTDSATASPSTASSPDSYGMKDATQLNITDMRGRVEARRRWLESQAFKSDSSSASSVDGASIASSVASQRSATKSVSTVASAKLTMEPTKKHQQQQHRAENEQKRQGKDPQELHEKHQQDEQQGQEEHIASVSSVVNKFGGGVGGNGSKTGSASCASGSISDNTGLKKLGVLKRTQEWERKTVNNQRNKHGAGRKTKTKWEAKTSGGRKNGTGGAGRYRKMVVIGSSN